MVESASTAAQIEWVMMDPIMVVIFPLICVGIIVGGVLIVKNRASLWEDTRDRQRRLVGRHISGAFERMQNSFWIGAVGVFAVFVGTGLLLRYSMLLLT